MSRFWSHMAEKVHPYVPGEQPKDKKYIKLNTNENPYPPSPKVIEAIKQAANDDLRLYPDPNCDNLRETAARYYELNKNQVFIGNGSDEVLAFSFMAFFNPGEPILFNDITYSFYPVYAGLFGIDYKLVPLDDNYEVPAEMFFQENGGVVIADPNAPTSKYMSIQLVKDILEYNNDSVVIIDEAYVDFGGESTVKLINQYPNLLVIQTLSKSRSLAGLRIGLALGSEELIEGINRIKNSINSYTLDRIALAGAKAAFEDEGYFQETTQKIIRTRERISKQLTEIGFNVLDSKANFIFISHAEFHASAIFKALREKGILVRYFDKPRIDNFLRVSIGTDQEMDCLFKAIKEIIKT